MLAHLYGSLLAMFMLQRKCASIEPFYLAYCVVNCKARGTYFLNKFLFGAYVSLKKYFYIITVLIIFSSLYLFIILEMNYNYNILFWRTEKTPYFPKRKITGISHT